MPSAPPAGIATPNIEFTQPNHYTFVHDVAVSLYETWRNQNASETFAEQTKYAYFNPWVLVYMVVAAIAWTITRSIVTSYILQPVGRCCTLPENQHKKFAESAWLALTYTVFQLFTTYLCVYKYQLFTDPMKICYEWNPSKEIPWDMCAAYLLQASFYVHASWATCVLDEWKKDSPLLLVHHAVTIILMGTSYAYRYQDVGIFVLFLHDACDVILNTTKVLLCFKAKGGKWDTYCDPLTTVGFAAFGASWYILRLHWYPLRLIYTTAHYSKVVYPDWTPPLYFFNNCLLISLLFMHIYWFKFIVQMAYTLLTGKSSSVEDTREYEPTSNGNHAVANGGGNKKKKDTKKSK